MTLLILLALLVVFYFIKIVCITKCVAESLIKIMIISGLIQLIKYMVVYIGEGNGTPTPVLLPGKSHGRRSLVGCSPWGCKESDMTE